MRFELNDRNGNFILGVTTDEHLARVLRFMRANDPEADTKLIIWAYDQNNDVWPVDPTTI